MLIIYFLLIFFMLIKKKKGKGDKTRKSCKFKPKSIVWACVKEKVELNSYQRQWTLMCFISFKLSKVPKTKQTAGMPKR